MLSWESAATAVVAAMLAVHHLRGTWVRRVRQFIALSEFSRGKFIEGGLPAAKVAVKANFMRHDPGCGSGAGNYAVFAGRLAGEGRGNAACRLATLETTAAAENCGRRSAGRSRPHGRCWTRPWSSSVAVNPAKSSRCWARPSAWSCRRSAMRTALRRLSRPTPGARPVASRLGAMGEMVEHGRTGMLFAAGDAKDLAHTIDGLTADTAALPSMRGQRGAVTSEDIRARGITLP